MIFLRRAFITIIFAMTVTVWVAQVDASSMTLLVAFVTALIIIGAVVLYASRHEHDDLHEDNMCENGLGPDLL